MIFDKEITFVKIKTECWIEAVIFFIGFLMSRPMILGNIYSPIGLGILFIVTVYECCRNRGRIKINHHFDILKALVVFFIYCAIQGIILRSDRLYDGLQTVVYLLGCAVSFYFLCKNKNVQIAFIRIMYYALSFFSLSFIISSLLMLMKDWNSIHLFDFDYGYFRDVAVYFPFTPTYGDMPFNGVIFKRLLGFSRESGIMQLFYIWGFYMADKYFDKSLIVKLLMCIGVAGCLSSTGFIVFAISLFFYLDIKKLFSWKTLIAVTLIIIAVYVLFYAQGTSIASRAQATITDRTIGMATGLSAFMSDPIFGKGFYDTLGQRGGVQVGVSAIASLGQVGIIGFALWLMIYLVSFKSNRFSKRFIYSCVSIVITALFSQPLLAAPAIYIFNFMDYDEHKYFVKKKAVYGIKSLHRIKVHL